MSKELQRKYEQECVKDILSALLDDLMKKLQWDNYRLRMYDGEYPCVYTEIQVDVGRKSYRIKIKLGIRDDIDYLDDRDNFEDIGGKEMRTLVRHILDALDREYYLQADEVDTLIQGKYFNATVSAEIYEIPE